MTSPRAVGQADTSISTMMLSSTDEIQDAGHSFRTGRSVAQRSESVRLQQGIKCLAKYPLRT